MNPNVIILVFITIVILLSQEYNQVKAGNASAILKNSLHDNQEVGNVFVTTPKGADIWVDYMWSKFLEKNPGENSGCQPWAYTADNFKSISFNAKVPSHWPDIIFVRREFPRAILKDSLHNDKEIGVVYATKCVDNVIKVSHMLSRLLEKYPNEKLKLQGFAYTPDDNQKISIDADVPYGSVSWLSDVIFVRSGSAKAYVMDHVKGETLSEPVDILSEPAKSMTILEMSNNIVIPERKRFSGKVYKVDSEKNIAKKVSTKSKAVFEAEYIFIVEPLLRDQIRGALTRVYEKSTRRLPSKKNNLVGKNLTVDENEEKENKGDAEN